MKRTNREVRQMPHYVYRLSGRRGAVLYVGCSMRPEARIAEHRRTLILGPRVSQVQIEGPYDFSTARAIERAQIERHQPPFNTEHTTRERRGVALYKRSRTS